MGKFELAEKDSLQSILYDCEEEAPTACRKNLGEQKKMRRWSRGHQFIIRSGGHIDAFQPLYK